MKYTVAVVGGGPAGASAAEIFAQDKTVDTYMIERKMDNCKPCGGAIPLCMVSLELAHHAASCSAFSLAPASLLPLWPASSHSALPRTV
jgi:2-polyprenyl-6-methoxyphenol hydroxylase-like FAD-dependent oxidoreductase